MEGSWGKDSSLGSREGTSERSGKATRGLSRFCLRDLRLISSIRQLSHVAL